MGNEVVKKLPIDWNAEKGDGTIAPAPCAPAAQMGVYVWKCLGCPNCRGFSFPENRHIARAMCPQFVGLLRTTLADHVRCAHPSFQEPEPLFCPACGAEVVPYELGDAWRVYCSPCGFYAQHSDRAELERILRKLAKRGKT